MSGIKSEKAVTYKLEVDEEHRQWLMAFCQNPINENESEHEQEMREDFFKALKSAK